MDTSLQSSEKRAGSLGDPALCVGAPAPHTTATATSLFISQVHQEVIRARLKWPGNRVQLAALTEEVGELAQALLKHDFEGGPAAAVWKEAVQVAAMAIRVATEGDSSFGYAPLRAASAAECDASSRDMFAPMIEVRS